MHKEVGIALSRTFVARAVEGVTSAGATSQGVGHDGARPGLGVMTSLNVEVHDNSITVRCRLRIFRSPTKRPPDGEHVLFGKSWLSPDAIMPDLAHSAPWHFGWGWPNPDSSVG